MSLVTGVPIVVVVAFDAADLVETTVVMFCLQQFVRLETGKKRCLQSVVPSSILSINVVLLDEEVADQLSPDQSTVGTYLFVNSTRLDSPLLSTWNTQMKQETLLSKIKTWRAIVYQTNPITSGHMLLLRSCCPSRFLSGNRTGNNRIVRESALGLR